MRDFRKGRIWLTVLAACLLAAPAAFAQGVEVYAEGAYTETDLVVYLYADVVTAPILSFGVKLTYDPARLAVSSVDVNTDAWFMGDAPPGAAYPGPDTSTAGEIVFVGGKLDTLDPTAGVAPAARVLLGTVRFVESGAGWTIGEPAADPAGAQNFFGVSALLGRASPFDNFVGTDGMVLDGGVVFLGDTGLVFAGDTIVRRGDANGDGMVTNVDMGMVRNLILGRAPVSGYVVFADANGDGMITNVDMGMIRNIILGRI